MVVSPGMAAATFACDEERVHDAQEWVVEADAVIKDVCSCVFSLTVSKRLSVSDSCVYLNLTTLEMQQYTVELSVAGFRVVSLEHDSTEAPTEDYYETPYSLLDNLSPLYRQRFCSNLAAKLELVAKQRELEEEQLQQ